MAIVEQIMVLTLATLGVLFFLAALIGWAVANTLMLKTQIAARRAMADSFTRPVVKAIWYDEGSGE